MYNGGAIVDRGILGTGELIVWWFSSCSALSFFSFDIKSYAGGISSIRNGLYWVFGMMMGIAIGERRFKSKRRATKISAHHSNHSVPIVEQIFVSIDRNSRWAHRWQWRKWSAARPSGFYEKQQITFDVSWYLPPTCESFYLHGDMGIRERWWISQWYFLTMSAVMTETLFVIQNSLWSHLALITIDSTDMFRRMISG